MQNNLIVIIGSLRGGLSSFRSTIKAVPGTYALLVAKDADHPYWYKHARYDWSFQDPSNWDTAFDDFGLTWRTCSDVPNQWLGPSAGQPGSAGILLWCRRALESLVSNLAYDNLVILRSDCLWASLLPDGSDSILVPDGEHYGGITDRTTIIPWGLLPDYFSAIRRLWEDSTLKDDLLPLAPLNLERFLAYSLRKLPLKFFPWNTVCIRALGDSTRWAKGVWCPRLQKVIKYQSEYNTVCRNYGDDWRPL